MTQLALLDAAHKQGLASMQRHHGSWSRSFQMVLVRSATTGERCTFWPPPLLWTLRLGATAARRVLSHPFPSACACHVPFYYLHRVLAAASPLRAAPFPVNACVSFPPQTARFSAHRMLAAPEIHRRRNVFSATALVPCAPYFTCTLVASWREPAAHAGAQTVPHDLRTTPTTLHRLLPLRSRSLAATRAHTALRLRASAPLLNVTAPSGLLADLRPAR